LIGKNQLISEKISCKSAVATHHPDTVHLAQAQKNAHKYNVLPPAMSSRRQLSPPPPGVSPRNVRRLAPPLRQLLAGACGGA
jgi:hypothetical protein